MTNQQVSIRVARLTAEAIGFNLQLKTNFKTHAAWL
jgi:hypothetical protein